MKDPIGKECAVVKYIYKWPNIHQHGLYMILSNLQFIGNFLSIRPALKLLLLFLFPFSFLVILHKDFNPTIWSPSLLPPSNFHIDKPTQTRGCNRLTRHGTKSVVIIRSVVGSPSLL